MNQYIFFAALCWLQSDPLVTWQDLPEQNDSVFLFGHEKHFTAAMPNIYLMMKFKKENKISIP